LRVSEDAAQKRVQRAIEKLKSLLEAKGVSVSVAALGAALLSHASPVSAAPPIDAITHAAISKQSTFTSARSPFLQAMKTKIAVGLSLLVLLVGGSLY